jgi:hypothetical protein
MLLKSHCRKNWRDERRVVESLFRSFWLEPTGKNILTQVPLEYTLTGVNDDFGRKCRNERRISERLRRLVQLEFDIQRYLDICPKYMLITLQRYFRRNCRGER